MYKVEQNANSNLRVEDIYINAANIYEETDINIFYILCYYINKDSKYPFLEFMLEKVSCSNEWMTERFILPYILITNTEKSIEELVTDKIQKCLKHLGYSEPVLSSAELYKGLVYDKNNKIYAMVNITDLDIHKQCEYYLSRKSACWFVLPTEIINNMEICNIPVEQEVVDLFTSVPSLGLLTNVETDSYYLAPDVAYTGDEMRKVKFAYIFGERKRKIYETGGEYYHFYKHFKDAVKDGGWIKEGGIHKVDEDNEARFSVSGNLLVDNDYGRYISGGINRYAVFAESIKLIKKEEDITEEFDEDCLVIQLEEMSIKPDFVVKEYTNFVSLSYHLLDKAILEDRYKYSKGEMYMIK